MHLKTILEYLCNSNSLVKLRNQTHTASTYCDPLPFPAPLVFKIDLEFTVRIFILLAKLSPIFVPRLYLIFQINKTTTCSIFERLKGVLTSFSIAICFPYPEGIVLRIKTHCKISHSANRRFWHHYLAS
jgi:hypothetical protein